MEFCLISVHLILAQLLRCTKISVDDTWASSTVYNILKTLTPFFTWCKKEYHVIFLMYILVAQLWKSQCTLCHPLVSTLIPCYQIIINWLIYQTIYINYRWKGDININSTCIILILTSSFPPFLFFSLKKNMDFCVFVPGLFPTLVLLLLTATVTQRMLS